MKVPLCVLTVLILFSGTYAHALEPTYYWGRGEQIPVYPFKWMMTFRTQGDTLSTDLSDWLEETEINVFRWDWGTLNPDYAWKGVTFWTWPAHDSEKIAAFMEKYELDPEIKWADYYYDGFYGGTADSTVNLGHLLQPMGMIYISYPEGYTQSDEDSLVSHYGLTFVNLGYFDFKFYFVPDKTNIWDLANEIYENVPDVRAYPDFTGGEIRHNVAEEKNTMWEVSVFPNPSNPSATIQYTLPFSADVVIDIYSVTGQRIATLVEDYKQAGSHSVVFDGSSLSSGLYFYRVSAGKLARTG